MSIYVGGKAADSSTLPILRNSLNELGLTAKVWDTPTEGFSQGIAVGEIYEAISLGGYNASDTGRAVAVGERRVFQRTGTSTYTDLGDGKAIAPISRINNVDNTSDANKPVSTLQQVEFNRLSFKTVALMLSSTVSGKGAGTIWRADHYTYKEAASNATDHDLLTAGGVKLYVIAPHRVMFEQLGSVGDDTTVNTTAIQQAIYASERIGHRNVGFISGGHVTGPLTFPSNGFDILGPCPPKNQGQSSQNGWLRAATAGQTTLYPRTPTGGESTIMSCCSFRNIIFKGNSSTDISTVHIDIPNSIQCYSNRLEDVGFLYGDWGLRAPNGFCWILERVHGWYVDTCIAYAGSSVSTEYRNCRTGRTRIDAAIVNITGITLANAITYNGSSIQQPVITCASPHGITDGKLVHLTGIVGPTKWNDRLFIAKNCTSTTFELKGVNGVGAAAYVSGGTANKSACCFWIAGWSNVYNIDNSSENGAKGYVNFIIGRSPALNYFDEGNDNSRVTFFGGDLEGSGSALVSVCSGSSIDVYSCVISANTNTLAQAFYFEYINDVSNIFGVRLIASHGSGGFTYHVRCGSVDGTNGAVLYTPTNLSTNLTSYSEATGTSLPTANFKNLAVPVSTQRFSRFNMSTTTTIPSVSTDMLVIFDATQTNTDASYSTTTGFYTSKELGTYISGGTIQVSGGAAGKFIRFRIKKNGTVVNESTRYFDGTNPISIPVSMINSLSIGDTLGFYLATDATANSVTISSGQAYSVTVTIAR